MPLPRPVMLKEWACDQELRNGMDFQSVFTPAFIRFNFSLYSSSNAPVLLSYFPYKRSNSSFSHGEQRLKEETSGKPILGTKL